MKRSLLLFPVMALVLFGPAGTLNWWNGWVFLSVLIVVTVLTSKVFRESPSLARERRSALKKANGWEKALVSLVSAVLPLISLILAGFDKRFGWTRSMPPSAPLFGFILMIGGSALTYWAMKSNPFFSSVIRIQKDRRHRVISNGPYASLRHPGYSGAILYNLAGPVLLGSFVALGVGFLIVLLLVIRTAQEDRTLQRKLAGYKEYTAKVRYRLVPYVW